VQERIEDTKEVIRSRKSKDKQNNGQKEKRKSDRHITTQKAKD